MHLIGCCYLGLLLRATPIQIPEPPPNATVSALMPLPRACGIYRVQWAKSNEYGELILIQYTSSACLESHCIPSAFVFFFKHLQVGVISTHPRVRRLINAKVGPAHAAGAAEHGHLRLSGLGSSKFDSISFARARNKPVSIRPRYTVRFIHHGERTQQPLWGRQGRTRPCQSPDGRLW
jgi:hypothetical protein